MSQTPPVHLVLGDDPRFRADAIKALIAELLGADDPSLALEEFSLVPRGDTGEGDAAQAADGPPIVSTALGSASHAAVRHRTACHRHPRGRGYGRGRR